VKEKGEGAEASIEEVLILPISDIVRFKSEIENLKSCIQNL